jgi:hypothetical protein
MDPRENRLRKKEGEGEEREREERESEREERGIPRSMARLIQKITILRIILSQKTKRERERETMSSHGPPPPHLECLCTFDEISLENENYCEYFTVPSGTWRPSLFSSSVVRELLRTQVFFFLTFLTFLSLSLSLTTLLISISHISLMSKKQRKTVQHP